MKALFLCDAGEKNYYSPDRKPKTPDSSAKTKMSLQHQTLATKMQNSFKKGSENFLRMAGLDREHLIQACKRKYPKLGGRCVNIVQVPEKWLGIQWGPNFVVDPGRIAIEKARVRKAFDRDLGEEHYKTIETQIDKYDPDHQVLFLICTNIKGHSFSDMYTIGNTNKKKQ